MVTGMQVQYTGEQHSPGIYFGITVLAMLFVALVFGVFPLLAVSSSRAYETQSHTNLTGTGNMIIPVFQPK